MKEIPSDARFSPADERIILDAVRAIRGPKAEEGAHRALERLRDKSMILVADDVRPATAATTGTPQLLYLEPADLRKHATETALAFHRRADDDEVFASHVIAGTLGLIQTPRRTYMHGAMGLTFPVAIDPVDDLIERFRATLKNAAAAILEFAQSTPVLTLLVATTLVGGGAILVANIVRIAIPDHIQKIGGDIIKIPLSGGPGGPGSGGSPGSLPPKDVEEAYQRYLECLRAQNRTPRVMAGQRSAELTVHFPFDDKTRHSCTIKASFATPLPTLALVQFTISDSGIYDRKTGEKLEFDGEMVRENCHNLIEESKECVRFSTATVR